MKTRNWPLTWRSDTFDVWDSDSGIKVINDKFVIWLFVRQLKYLLSRKSVSVVTVLCSCAICKVFVRRVVSLDNDDSTGHVVGLSVCWLLI